MNLKRKIQLEKLDPACFHWRNWSAGSIHDLGLCCRFLDIISAKGKKTLRKYAIGYCLSENLYCRPRINEVAIMCFKEGGYFWFHLRKKEFEIVFIVQ